LKFYFNRNQNLLADLAWDDCDSAVPSPGKFKSKLLLGPKGVLTRDNTINTRLQKLNGESAHIKRKLITYGAYMHNPYLEPAAERYLESTLMYPITFFTIKFPAHLAREHPVLKMLNRDIACVDVTSNWKSIASPPFLYALNDGITPLSSALFLPEDTLKSVPLVSLSAVGKLRGKTDVKLARAFKDADHLTFIDGSRPVSLSSKMQDELRPEEGEKDVFAWMLQDVLNIDRLNQQLADEPKTKLGVPDDAEATGTTARD
jgi:hypothetical protein